MTPLLFSIFLIIFGYLLGSIPFGLVFTRLAGLGDIRKIGSGNIGATNVLRTGHKMLALLTLICDSSKGAVAALIALWLAPSSLAEFLGLATGTAAVLGHNFPIWLNFKGGKGVATTLGMMLVTVPSVGFITLIIWLSVAIITRYSSLSSIIAFAFAPFYALFYGSQSSVVFFGFLGLLSLYMHRGNLQRLQQGTETKIGRKNK